MRAPIYLNIYFSEAKKKQNTATQNMKHIPPHETYLFRFVAVTNFRKWRDCFGFIFQNLRCASSRVCYINLFRRTLRNLLYEKGLPTTGGPSNEGIVASQKRHPAGFLLTVSQTARANGNIIFKLIWIAVPNRQLTKTLPSQIITLQLIDTGKIFSYN